jgi:hypothetical protein
MKQNKTKRSEILLFFVLLCFVFHETKKRCEKETLLQSGTSDTKVNAKVGFVNSLCKISQKTKNVAKY